MRIRKLAVLLVVIAVTIVSVSIHANAAADNDPVAKAIQKVISSQIEAFKVDDARRAFSYAAPQIQAQFGNPDRFMSMVRNGYQPVYRPKYVEFVHLAETVDGEYAQHVIVQAPTGEVVMAVYPMIQDNDGNWRIAGVYLKKLPRKST